VELPTDEGPVDYGGQIVRFDLADKVPVGQPVEIRIGLKWWGDPGSSADLDIWVNIPGTKDAYNPGRYDESLNWNIINKVRVANGVRIEGQPFEIGIQVNNGRIVHPSGVKYSVTVDLYFAKDVVAPGVAYGINVPSNATGIIVQSVRLAGDEHLNSKFVVVDPDNRLAHYVEHNDIGVETLFLPVKKPGEYVIYVHSMYGGFLSLESEVPNPSSMARILPLVVTNRVLHAGPDPSPGTYIEQGATGGSTNTFGKQGSFSVDAGFPLDIIPWIQSTGGEVDAAINITSPVSWTATAFAQLHREDERGRIGGLVKVRTDRDGLAMGSYRWGVVSNGPGISLGATVVSFTR
jgi:hypothetical protein